VDSLEQALDFVSAFYHLRLPHGRRVAIVSGPGGLAVGAADACIHAGLELAELSVETRQRLAKFIPPVGTSLNNPVDLSIAVLTRSHLYSEAVEILSDDKNADMQVVIGAVASHQFSEAFVDTARTVKRPLALVLPYPPDLVPEEYRFLQNKGIATYPDAKRAAEALAAMADYAEFRRHTAASSPKKFGSVRK
jgi:acyl-CoA synthetase (NDP forming)